MYGDPMAGLDAWLEAPYVERARDEARFEEWCEDHDVDPEAPDAWDRYEEWEAGELEAHAEAMAEDRAEREYESRYDRD